MPIELPKECHASMGCAWPDCACQGYTKAMRDAAYFAAADEAYRRACQTEHALCEIAKLSQEIGYE
jgi:hypothetical protein